jgi:hypothetical protein
MSKRQWKVWAQQWPRNHGHIPHWPFPVWASPLKRRKR